MKKLARDPRRRHLLNRGNQVVLWGLKRRDVDEAKLIEKSTELLELLQMSHRPIMVQAPEATRSGLVESGD